MNDLCPLSLRGEMSAKRKPQVGTRGFVFKRQLSLSNEVPDFRVFHSL